MAQGSLGQSRFASLGGSNPSHTSSQLLDTWGHSSPRINSADSRRLFHVISSLCCLVFVDCYSNKHIMVIRCHYQFRSRCWKKGAQNKVDISLEAQVVVKNLSPSYSSLRGVFSFRTGEAKSISNCLNILRRKGAITKLQASNLSVWCWLKGHCARELLRLQGPFYC